MRIGKFTFRLNTLAARIYRLLGKIWFVPFGFYSDAILGSGSIPHPLVPRNLRDLILHKMMFPDNSERAIVADKIALRGWAAERIDAQHLIPLYDICDTPEDLKFDQYPMPYVVKPNHASGQYHFVHTPADLDGLRDKTREWLSAEYNSKKEWIYRDMDRKIMVEKLLIDPNCGEIWDIKLHCFYGEPALIASIRVRGTNLRHTYLTTDWQRVDMEAGQNLPSEVIEKPAELNEILRIARILSAEFDYIRVDLYICDGQVYVGELTSFSMAGNWVYKPSSVDEFLFNEFKRRGKMHVADKRAAYHTMATDSLKR